MVFLGSSCRETAKNVIKKSQTLKKTQKGTYLPDLLAICQIYPRFIFFFLSRPLACASLPLGVRGLIALYSCPWAKKYNPGDQGCPLQFPASPRGPRGFSRAQANRALRVLRTSCRWPGGAKVGTNRAVGFL